MSGYLPSKLPRRLDIGTKLIIGVVTFAVLSATARIYQFAIEWRHLGRAMELSILAPSSFAWLQLVFILSFFLCALGVLMRNLLGLMISILGLTVALGAYIYWYSYSSQWLAALRGNVFYTEHPEFMPPHFFGLVQARWWDVIILLISALLFCWLISLLAKNFKRLEGERITR